jgi:rfaE bifunctional protein nucleotidyltransferase chain/domain
MSHHNSILTKIHTSSQTLAQLVKQWQHEGKKVVFTNGCFDLLHLGHVDYLAKAADCGNKLIIGVNTDTSISNLKGPSRPIQNQQSRLQILASLQCVDAVILFDEQTPYNLIKTLEPDVLVKGSDYEPQNIIGYDIVTAKGGKVTTIDFIPGYSTSDIERKIKNS